jgi:phosphate transport system substrate-binding protein
MHSHSRGILFLIAAILSLQPCKSFAQSETILVVTGSSMPEPLYRAWAAEYHKHNPAVEIRYLAVGTSESAQDVLKGSGDFGGGEAPLSVAEQSGDHGILQLPAVLIGIVVVYNLPQTPGELRLTGKVLADIYLGKIKQWNDPAIAKLNAGLQLPDLPIHVFHRTAGKGSNYIFSNYLSKVSPEFLTAVGHGDSPKWPVGNSIQRSQDLHEKVAATPGSIGYTELNLAAGASLHVALIQNASGDFVKPTRQAIAEAAQADAGKGSASPKTSLINAPGKSAYPISSYSWIYVPAVAKDPERGRAVAEFLKWTYGTGQTVAEHLGYATLPQEILANAVSKVTALH